ncbi:aldehyde ferredoxin oxidoreductase [Candidatus Aerophobetes bacterium]|uniref:Aldehyde ferredoxin oxidoreductase n=2 Tax=Aerophobetes bacterium TaxID=2030807 RepID=A0A497E368_UNCAE|nr:MAG: aldehyde ferredoxin oxidoreductase [Candidatus Aerophobetes bacterium]
MVNKYSLGGKILRINLTTQEISTEQTVKYTEEFLGGRGINQGILLKELRPEISPFDPANKLAFGVGTLVGTGAPGANRLSIDSKNVFTGGIGSSNCCGRFAAELKFAGYDHLIVEGKAEKPVYLWINNNQVEIKDASHLWGNTTWETENMIREEIGDKDIQILSIGPAGENLVRFACIIVNPSRAAGKCGLGAIMGSKNLKAVVVKGRNSIEVAEYKRFIQITRKLSEKIKKSENTTLLRKYGTLVSMFRWNECSSSPVKNFQDGYMDPKKMEKISYEVFCNTYKEGDYEFGCPIGCAHSYRVKSGPYAGVYSKKLETNCIWDFATTFDIDYAPAIIKIQSLCSQYGMDIDGASCAIAWAFECYQRKIITDKDTEGLELKWGDYKVIIKLLKKIAYREGFGNILAEGSKRASEMIGRGSEKYSINVKGQDLREAIRVLKGWALGNVVSARGGAHTRGAPLTESRRISQEISKKLWGVPTAGDPTTYKGKATIVVYYERLHAMMDALGVCFFTSNWISPDLLGPADYAELFSAATGLEVTGEELMMIGERIHTVEKMFNVYHAGFTRKDDYPPKRLMEEPIKSGPFKGEYLEREKWDKMLDEYYELHNWDKKTGLPTKQTLQKMGLEWILNLNKNFKV